MEWATIAGAAVGGAIAITGDLIGQISARKQAAKQRRETLEDAERVRAQTMEDERRKELQRRGRQAEEKMIELVVGSQVAIVNPLSEESNREEIIRATLEISKGLCTECVHVLDDELRRRLKSSGDILDMATTPVVNLRKERLNEVVAIVRQNVYLWLGASLRGQVILPPTQDWLNLMAELDQVQTQWQGWLKQAGYEFHPYK